MENLEITIKEVFEILKLRKLSNNEKLTILSKVKNQIIIESHGIKNTRYTVVSGTVLMDIMGEDAYYKAREIRELKCIRPAGGKGYPALYEYKSVPEEYKKDIPCECIFLYPSLTIV